MSVSMQDVRNLFERYGWQCHEHDAQTLLAGFRGESGDFVIGARLSKDWLTLSVPKYLPSVPSEQRSNLFAHLMRVNAQVEYVRFALESESEITILADLPAYKRLNYDLFAMAIDLLSYYADEAYEHLHEMITGGPLPEAVDGADE